MERPAAPFRPEALLAHREWIERTARALVHGDAEAEDVAQQAWLEVLERPPAAAPERPRGWLGAVLRFTALDRMRGERRRRRREEAAARPERVDASPPDIVARAETLDRVVHAVLELEEPCRTTVLLRYFEDLPPRDIAARQGIPVETVRTRLKRAMARLRERLDAGSGGDRRRWCLALLPLLRRPSSTAAAAGASASVAAGALLMGMKAKIAVAAVVVVLVAAGGVLLVRPWEGGSPQGRSLPRIPVVPVEQAAVQPTEDPAPPPRPASFAARVEDTGGKPIAGARVEVRPAREGKYAAWCGDPVFARGTTDADGRLALDLAREALTQGREVRASSPGFTTATVRTNEAEVVLRLVPAAILKGRVFDAATGRGLGQVALQTVRGRPGSLEVVAQTLSGDEGTFSMDALPPGTYTLQARPSAWLEAEVANIVVEAGTPRTVDIPLLPGVRMEGTILDSESGAPIEKGRLISPGLPDFQAEKVAVLGPGGKFVLGGLPARSGVNPSNSYSLEATGYLLVATTETPAAYDINGKQTREALLRARPEAWWNVRVLDPEGRGVAGARVAIGTSLILWELQDLDRMGNTYLGNARMRLRESVTDGEGRCRLPAGWLQRAQGNNSWEQRLLVLHPAFAPHYESVGPDFWRNSGEVRLERGVRLDVEVVDREGRPQPRAEIRTALLDTNPEFKGIAKGDLFGSFEGPAISDGAGRVSLTRLCAGEWEVRVWSADGLRRAANSVLIDGPGPASCKVTLEDAPPVLGTVVDAETGLPLSGAVVRMLSNRTEGPRTAVADSGGRFEFRFAEKEDLLPGFVLSASEVPGSGFWQHSREDAQAGVPVTMRLRCIIRETRQISGRVLDAATGLPVASGFVGTGWRDPRTPSDRQGGNWRFAEGRFTGWFPVVDGLQVSFTAPGYAPREMPLEELEAQGCEVRLVSKGAPEESAAKYRLRVRVSGGEHPAGKDLPGFANGGLYDPETKQALRRKGTNMELTVFGMLPEFVLTEHELPGPGRVLLELQVYGWYMAAPAECSLEAGKETEVSIDLIQGGGMLVGKAEAESGSRIALTYPSGLVRKLWVGDEGKFNSGNLAPGTYTLAIEGGQPVTATATHGVRTTVDLRK